MGEWMALWNSCYWDQNEIMRS